MMIDLIKIVLPAVLTFGVGILITPFLTSLLYKKKAWKKKAGKKSFNGEQAKVFNALHKEKEVGTPRMGGVVIWGASFIAIVGLWVLAIISGNDVLVKLDFLSRDQTWIPLFALVAGAVVGLIDDMLEVQGSRGGLSLRYRLLAVGMIGLFCGWWFFEKLEVTGIGLPMQWGGELTIGWLIVPVFALVMMAVYSGGVIDGLDGLAGGIFATIFASYGLIAFVIGQTNLAAFCTMIAGGILAFLWFNIPPARFYMSETGSMALTATLTVVVFMSDALGGGYGILVLPVIAFPLVATSGSVILQLCYRKVFHTKLFRVAPIHHHFEAIGWPAYKVVMRYWIIGVVCAIAGTILAIIGI